MIVPILYPFLIAINSNDPILLFPRLVRLETAPTGDEGFPRLVGTVSNSADSTVSPIW